jgi:predicted nucleic acid-binding protein
MTRPGDLTGTIPIKSLIEDIQYFTTRFNVAEDGSMVTDRLLTLVEDVAVRGKQIHDANIVATMLANNIGTLLTHNTDDFTQFSTKIKISPLILSV